MSNKQHNPSTQRVSDHDLDVLLDELDFLEVPQQFTDNVMQQIDESTQSVIKPKTEWWQWFALIGGGIPAFLQILAFIFSAWNVASLG